MYNMEKYNLCRHCLLTLILLLIAGMVNLGQVTVARGGDDVDQSKCFNNLLLNLPNQSFSASSVWDKRAEFLAFQARMSTMIDMSSNQHGQAWCSNDFLTENSTEWLEIDLGDMKFINCFLTMGRGEGNFKEFVSYFFLEYKREVAGVDTWIRYKNMKNGLMNGNGDSRNVDRTRFSPMITARIIRIYPISKEVDTRACLRIGIYGCNFDDGIIEYSIPQGHLYTLEGNDYYDFRDVSYDGRTLDDSFTHSRQLVHGLGQLTDNYIFQGTIHVDKSQNATGNHFVGWNRKKMPSSEVDITLKLDQIRKLKEIKLYTLNMIPNEIGVFASATVHFSIGGEIYDMINPPYIYNTTADRRVFHSRWIDIPLRGVLCRYLKLKLVFDLDWMVLSEIQLVSERSDIVLSVEKYNPIRKSTVEIINQTSTLGQKDVVDYSKAPVKKEVLKITDKGSESSFSTHSKVGFIATITSCVLGFLLLFALLLVGFISVRRCQKRVKGKYRHTSYPVRINGGQFLGDSLIVPLTAGTNSSSGAGSFYRKRQGSADLGLSYPITGKEYMTLSSKSGTDYDMASGNSLDGLLPISQDQKYSGPNSYFSQHTLSDNPYPLGPYSRHSIDGSLGSSYTEYATTSPFHLARVLENGSNRISYIQPRFSNHFPLQSMSPSHTSYGASPYHFNCPPTLAPILPANQMSDLFPNYSPYRNFPYPMNYHREQNSSPTQYNMILLPCVKLSANMESSPHGPASNALPPIQGIFGNSLMAFTDDVRVTQSPTNSLTDLLSNLQEVCQDEVEEISIMGKDGQGSIGFMRRFPREVQDRKLSHIYLSKSTDNFVVKDIRNQIIREMDILLIVKHSAFLQLSSFAFVHHNAVNMKQLTLCFLFTIDDQMENLYTFLRQHSAANSGVVSLSGDPISFSQTIADRTKTSNTGPRQLYPSVPSLLYLCYQISDGMWYLETHSIVHRDLAARNCFVGQNLTLKITDIAMSIPTFQDHYMDCTTIQAQSTEDPRRRDYPLQWMAFETILQGCYTTKTDVWSFGVTMWEILSRCQKRPFGEYGVTVDRVVQNANFLSIGAQSATLPSGILAAQHGKLSKNSIVESNLGLAGDFGELIIDCWHKNSLLRPSFENIRSFFEQKLSSLKKEPLITSS